MRAKLHPFDELVLYDEEEFRLAEAALYFAADHDSAVDIDACLETLDDLAFRVERLGGPRPQDQITALYTVLVEEEGLTGNTTDYYDPRNSFLNEVLARKCGIPISLSAIWLDVAERLGWPFYGVGFPGHFLIKRVGPGGDILVDPFNGGRVLKPEHCAHLFAGLSGVDVSVLQVQFTSCTKRATLARMLGNLNIIYHRSQNWPHMARVLQRLIALHPEQPQLIDQLGRVLERVPWLN